MQAKQIKTLQFARLFHSSSTRQIEGPGAKVNQEFSLKSQQETVCSTDIDDLVLTKGI